MVTKETCLLLGFHMVLLHKFHLLSNLELHRPASWDSYLVKVEEAFLSVRPPFMLEKNITQQR